MTVAHKYDCIQAHRFTYPVDMMCRVLQVSRSGFYGFCARQRSTHELEDAHLEVLLVQMFDEFKARYGVVRLWKEFMKRDIACGRDRVRRLMRKLDLVAKATRKRKPRTTQSEHGRPVAPNLLMRQFDVKQRDLVWLADISYLGTKQGWVYLACVMDLYSRKIVGWTVRESLERQGALDALEVALGNRRPEAGLIHHSDRGVQYASKDYQKRLEEAGARQSMSRKGDCWDNAPMESFFGRMKEELDVLLFESKEAAAQAVFKYIELFYNPTRSHSSLGYVSPSEFERQHAA